MFLKRLRDFCVPSKSNAYRPEALERKWLIFFLALILFAEGFLVTSLLVRPGAGDFLALVLGSEIISLTNAERAQADQGVLAENPLLQAAAQAKAEDMAHRSYFSHTGPDGKLPWAWVAEAGYDYHFAGENLAVRFVDSSDVIEAWMASPSHRENIVKPLYREIGVGVAHGMYKGEPATFVVQFFGTPRSTGELAAAAGQSSLSFMESFFKTFARAFAEPRSTASLVLWGVALLLLGVVALTFFVHVQVQPTDLLLKGSLVVLIALALVAVNARAPEKLSQNNLQAAALGSPLPAYGVIVGESGVSTERFVVERPSL